MDDKIFCDMIGDKLWCIGNQENYGLLIDTHKERTNDILNEINNYLNNNKNNNEYITRLFESKNKLIEIMKIKNYL